MATKGHVRGLTGLGPKVESSYGQGDAFSRGRPSASSGSSGPRHGSKRECPFTSAQRVHELSACSGVSQRSSIWVFASVTTACVRVGQKRWHDGRSGATALVVHPVGPDASAGVSSGANTMARPRSGLGLEEAAPTF